MKPKNRTQHVLLLRYVVFVMLCALPFGGRAQDDGNTAERMGPCLTRLQFETRLAWTGEVADGRLLDENAGFRGQFFNLRMDGQIVKGLDFSYRQRLNRRTEQSFWDATDWVTLTWHVNPHWQLSAGKQVVAIGGFEYDRAPIDLYYCSEYWQHIPCYQLGVSTTWQVNKQHALLMQFCNSPLRPWVGNNQYGLNLMWTGRVRAWQTLWSYNMMQRGGGEWMCFLALGNRFVLTPWMNVEADYTHRGAEFSKWFTGNFTVAGELNTSPLRSGRYKDALNIFAKYTYDHNKVCEEDLMVRKNTLLHSMGLGAEFHPIPLARYRDDLRLFVSATYVWGENAETTTIHPTAIVPDDNVLKAGKYYVQAGLKFRFDIRGAIEKMIRINEQ